MFTTTAECPGDTEDRCIKHKRCFYLGSVHEEAINKLNAPPPTVKLWPLELTAFEFTSVMSLSENM